MPNTTKPGLLDPDWDEKLRLMSQATEDFAKSHPGTAESLVPVWGSARESVADLYDGDYLGAAGNLALAASDLIPAKAVGGIFVKAGMKGAGKVAASLKAGRRLETALKDGRQAAVRVVVPPNAANWRGSVSKWYREQGYREKGEAAHHWLIERNSVLGKKYPQLVNQLWNLKPLDPVTHGRIHGPYTVRPGPQMPRFSLPDRVWNGTPAWAKGVAVGIPMRAGILTYEAQDSSKLRRR
jgi:hypothetical protein